MKLTFGMLCLAVALAAVSFFAGRGTLSVRVPVVHAQSGCDASSLTGAYGYNQNGYFYDSNAYVYYIGAAGRLMADGNGGITGIDTLSFDGTITHRKITGTYTMNADCTGSISMSVTYDNGQTGTVKGDLVAVNGAKEINFVQTDANTIVTGVLKQQGLTTAPTQ